MNKVRVLLIDDDENMGNMIEYAINSETGLELVGIAKNGVDGIEMAINLKPQIILLDLIMPIKDGFSVLNCLNELKNDIYKPKVIVLSSMSNDIEIMRSNSLGAIHFIAKPFEMSSLISSILFLSSSKEFIETKQYKERQCNSSLLHQYISELLDELALPSNFKGYTFLKEILKEKIINANKLYSLSKELYPMVAEKYNDVPYCVERSIRTVIQRAWNKNKFNKSKIFHNVEKCPSNSEFLSTVSNYIINQIS